MKGIIRWLSDISGVTKQVEKETTKAIGQRLYSDSTWFSSPERAMAGNALAIYGISLIENKHPSAEKVRFTLDDFKNESFHDEKNKASFQKVIWGVKS